MSHYIERCRLCGGVISQCRCINEAKEQRLGICEKCKSTASSPSPAALTHVDPRLAWLEREMRAVPRKCGVVPPHADSEKDCGFRCWVVDFDALAALVAGRVKGLEEALEMHACISKPERGIYKETCSCYKALAGLPWNANWTAKP